MTKFKTEKGYVIEILEKNTTREGHPVQQIKLKNKLNQPFFSVFDFLGKKHKLINSVKVNEYIRVVYVSNPSDLNGDGTRYGINNTVVDVKVLEGAK